MLGAAGATAALAACDLLPATGADASVSVVSAGPTTAVAPTAPEYTAELPPPAPREFRGAWVATVSNIDWPSAPGLSAAAQRAEAVVMMDRARQLGLNALILQVRPAGDAIYPSTLEPWTEYLSGEQGRPPYAAGEAAWDPLLFWITEAHRRGLELHAWFNPYRARHSSAKSPPAPSHIAARRPDLVRRYGDMLWMDPGEADAAAQTLAVVADVLRRYDIDGVHIDDYFYPYPVPLPGAPAAAQAASAAGAPGLAPPPPDLPFPDDESYARYRLASGPLSRDDWRRANVDGLVEALYRTVRALKPAARFGISPFGVGKPELRPAGIVGFSQYDKLYADVERWLAQGWLDYLAPQLYWQIGREGLQFPLLLDYWIAQNAAGRHVWPGLFTSQVARNWPAREILDQLDVLHGRAVGGAAGAALAAGHIHFSMIALMQDRDSLATLLQMAAYAQPALVPEAGWLSTATPLPAPSLKRRGRQVTIEGLSDTGFKRWAVWRRVGTAWRFAVLPGAERQIDGAGASAIAVQAVDRTGQLGQRSLLSL